LWGFSQVRGRTHPVRGSDWKNQEVRRTEKANMPGVDAGELNFARPAGTPRFLVTEEADGGVRDDFRGAQVTGTLRKLVKVAQKLKNTQSEGSVGFQKKRGDKSIRGGGLNSPGWCEPHGPRNGKKGVEIRERDRVFTWVVSKTKSKGLCGWMLRRCMSTATEIQRDATKSPGFKKMAGKG